MTYKLVQGLIFAPGCQTPLPVAVPVSRHNEDYDEAITYIYLNPHSCPGLTLRNENLDEDDNAGMILSQQPTTHVAVGDTPDAPSYIDSHTLHTISNDGSEHDMIRLRNPLKLFYLQQSYAHRFAFAFNECIQQLSTRHFGEQSLTFLGGLLAVELSHTRTNVIIDLPDEDFTLAGVAIAS